MVVTCPQCKVKLKVPDEKISPEGTRFKCPKCATVLNVKKPVRTGKTLDKNKVMIANAHSDVTEKMTSILTSAGFHVITSPDGVDAMMLAANELPYTAIIDTALPKIYGYEVCKKLKSDDKTKDIKVMLFTSVHDKNKYRRQPTTFYGADDYLEDHEIEDKLLLKIQALTSGSIAGTEAGRKSMQEAAEKPSGAAPLNGNVGTSPAGGVEWVHKAKRLARTVLADIFLYNPQKAEDAVRNGNFMDIFTSEIAEGRKLYDNRIPRDVRDQKDFFAEELNEFLEDKKKSLDM